MAFYIELEKIEHTNEYVRYKFYTEPDNVGIVEYNFVADLCVEVQHAPSDLSGCLYERAALKIVKHWYYDKEFPDKTCWAS